MSVFGRRERKIEVGRHILPKWKKVDRMDKFFSFMLFGIKEMNECTNLSSLFDIEMEGGGKRKIMLIN